MKMRKADMVIVGGGPAGLAAAVAAREAGCEDVLILERDGELGGILNQCIHNGFGLHTFQEELTGPEYADRYIKKAESKNIPSLLHTMVIDIQAAEDGKKLLTAMNREEGMLRIEAESVILAMGCRERPRGALNIPGFRPAGIYSAGTAQYFVNREGRMPGKEVVILGSGDIGLIMARRMTLEGAKVKLVAELMPYSGGLARNVVQCLEDFSIPLRLSTTVVDIHGKERLEGVTIARVDDKTRYPIPGTEERVDCDTLLLSCGLIPENELSAALGVEQNPITNGPVVNESLETSIAGVFACGNVLHTHDLVDYVSEEAASAGKKAAAYCRKKKEPDRKSDKKPDKKPDRIFIQTGAGVRYTVPSLLNPEEMEDKQVVRFRVDQIYREVTLAVYLDSDCIIRQKKRIMAPAEMEQLILKKEQLLSKKGTMGAKEIRICVEQEGGGNG